MVSTRTRARVRAVRIGAAVLALATFAHVARAEDAPIAKEAKAAAPASELGRLETEFLAAPGDVVRGLAYQDALLAEGKRERALKEFRKAATERPGDRVAAFLLARVEGGAEGFRAMWAALLARLGQPPGDDAGVVAGWDALVSAEEAEGRDERAAQALESRIAVKADGGAWVRLGWLRERLGNLAGAEEAYRKALALDAARPAARGGLALVLARQKKHAEAQRLARESVKASPDSADAWIHLGLVLSLAGDSRGAGDAYRQAYERARGDAAVLAVIGSSLAEIEQFDLAQKALDASLAADPTNGTVLAQAATVAVQREQWPEAKRLLALAAKALPKNAQVAFLQGVVAQRTQQEDAAVQAFRRAVSLDPAEPAYALALAKAAQHPRGGGTTVPDQPRAAAQTGLPADAEEALEPGRGVVPPRGHAGAEGSRPAPLPRRALRRPHGHGPPGPAAPGGVPAPRRARGDRARVAEGTAGGRSQEVNSWGQALFFHRTCHGGAHAPVEKKCLTPVIRARVYGPPECGRVA
jgi:tetratricopeptide (TPR) repeat protein